MFAFVGEAKYQKRPSENFCFQTALYIAPYERGILNVCKAPLT